MHRRTGFAASLSIVLAGLFLLVGCPPPPDPLEQPGPYDVYRLKITVPNPENPASPMEGHIYAPSNNGGGDIAPGPFPFALMMHGFGANYGLYNMYSNHLASHGTIVIGFNFIVELGFDGRHDYLARQATYVIDYALDEAGPLAGYVDGSRVAAAGHSLGGKISFYAAAIDPRISVVMTMDPSNSGGPPCFVAPDFCNAYPVAPNIVTGAEGLLDHVNAASFIMGTAPDPLFNPDEQSNAKYFFIGLDGQGLHAVKSPALYFDMGTISHLAWLSNPVTQRIARRTLAAWVKEYFEGEDMEAYLTGSIAEADVTAGLIQAIQTR
jgi:dienelactone hydrolase